MIEKLAYFLERKIEQLQLENTLDLQYDTHKFGPYSDRLGHLLDALDGSYLLCDKRLADAEPNDAIWFDDARKDRVTTYLSSAEAKEYREALENTIETIDGFQSPLGMELLATVDWLLHRQSVEPSVAGVKAGLRAWPNGKRAADRKLKLFDDRLISLALQKLGHLDPSAQIGSARR